MLYEKVWGGDLLVDNKNWNETFDYFYWCEYWSVESKNYDVKIK